MIPIPLESPVDPPEIAPAQAAILSQKGLDRWPKRLREIMDSLTPAVFVGILDLGGTLRYANRAALEAKALLAKDVLGRRFEDTPWWSTSNVSRYRIRLAISNAIAGSGTRFDVLMTDASGRLLTLDFSLQRVLGTNGDAGYLVASAHDVTERRQTERSLLATQVAVDHAQEAVLQVAVSGEIRYANEAACRLLGYERNELLKLHAFDLDGDMHPTEWPGWWAKVKASGRLEIQTSARHRSGRRVPIIVRASHIRHEDWECASVHLVDLSERTASEERIRRVADYDVTTGLPNRGRLRELLDQRLRADDVVSPKVALLIVSLERIKLLNDLLGQNGADQILAEVATRLTQCVGEAVLIGRVAPDEFAIVLDGEGLFATQASAIADSIVTALSPPIRVGEEDVYVACEIGIARHLDGGDTAEDLITNAGFALRDGIRCKETRVRHFAPRNRAGDRERLRLEAELHRATERSEFALAYQPRVETQTGKIVGLESLLRWPRPDGSLIPPGRFIPIAEETGLIHPIGAWALRSAVTQARAWQDRVDSPICVSVNLSARQFHQPQLAESIGRLLRDSGLDPHRLELELTESMLISDVEEAIRAMHALKDLGLRLSLDDFGTGYSSLSYLRRFPIDTLKIDQVFVQQMDTDGTSLAIVDAIMAIAHRLDLSVTAEGVETERQLNLLRERGCEELQGFLIGLPMAIEQVQSLLDARASLLPPALEP